MDHYFYVVQRDKALMPTIPDIRTIYNATVDEVNLRLLYFDTSITDKYQVVNTAKYPNSAIVPVPVYIYDGDITVEFKSTTSNRNEFWTEVFAGENWLDRTLPIQRLDDTDTLQPHSSVEVKGGTLRHFRDSFDIHRQAFYVYVDPNDNTAAPINVPVPFDPSLIPVTYTTTTAGAFVPDDTFVRGVNHIVVGPISNRRVNLTYKGAKVGEPDPAIAGGFGYVDGNSALNNLIGYTEAEWAVKTDTSALEDPPFTETEVVLSIKEPPFLKAGREISATTTFISNEATPRPSTGWITWEDDIFNLLP
jgi:hypothetical protein